VFVDRIDEDGLESVGQIAGVADPFGVRRPLGGEAVSAKAALTAGIDEDWLAGRDLFAFVVFVGNVEVPEVQVLVGVEQVF